MAFSRRFKLKTLLRMLQLYCGDQHQGVNPVCSQCMVHCYQPAQRNKIRQVMRFSGPKMLVRSPILTVRYMYRKRFKSTPEKVLFFVLII